MPRVAVLWPLGGRCGSDADATPDPARGVSPSYPFGPPPASARSRLLSLMPRGWWAGWKARSRSCALAPPSRASASVRTYVTCPLCEYVCTFPERKSRDLGTVDECACFKYAP
eukprot:6200423-Pleurochrysis_carterae.AAC.5